MATNKEISENDANMAFADEPTEEVLNMEPGKIMYKPEAKPEFTVDEAYLILKMVGVYSISYPMNEEQLKSFIKNINSIEKKLKQIIGGE